jgi:O-antigen/teichoic acid export membrane protein
VLTLFGAQWLPCVPILQVLALGGVLWPLHVLNLNILIAQGRSDLYFGINIFKKVFSISLTVAASFYGVMAIAWAQVAISIFAYFANTYYTQMLLGYSGWKQLRDLAPNFLAVMPMAMAVYFLNDNMQSSPIAKLVVAIACGGLVYLLTSRLLNAKLLNEFLEMVGIRKFIT